MRLLTLFCFLIQVTCLLAQSPASSPVRHTEAREYKIQRQIQLPGSVSSPTISTVAAEIAGLVVEIIAREGDTVEKGQVLARLRTRNLELRRQASQWELQEAQSRLKLSKKNLERVQKLFDSKVVSQQEDDNAFYEFSAWQGG